MSSLEHTRKARPAQEWSSETIFRPLAQLLVDPLARRNLDPVQVVLFHTALGLYAAYRLQRGGRLTPALLIQIKTVLDNLDGQLARATGRTTETGRYLDTEMDLVVNLALNVAVAGWRGVPLTGLQSLIMTTEFLWERDYRTAHGEVFRAQAGAQGDHPAVLAALKAVYAAYFEPQERLLGGLFERRLRRLAPEPTPQQRQAYTPLLINQITANLGLSTQLLAFGVCMGLGRPKWYTRSLLWQAALLVAVQLWREEQVNREI